VVKAVKAVIAVKEESKRNMARTGSQSNYARDDYARDYARDPAREYTRDPAREAARRSAAKKRAQRRERAERKYAKQQETRRKAERAAQESVASSRATRFSGSEKRAMIFVVAFIGLIFLIVIGFAAFNAGIQKDINKASAGSNAIAEDIDNIKVEIEKNRNIGTIEKRAIGELHMVYPDSSQYVYIDEIRTDAQDLAQKIKEKVYATE
jgi:cell division protein FtsL